MEIKLSDGRESLWQWDTGRYVTVTGTDATELHLSRGGARSAHVIEIADGKAEIPDHMLLKDGELVAYVMERDAGGGMTTYKRKFVVQARQRPEGYVYPPVRRWEELENRMDEIEKNSTNDHEKLLNRDTDDQHPISAITGLTTALNNNNSLALAAMQAAQYAGGAAGKAQETADVATNAAAELDKRLGETEKELEGKQPAGDYLTSETDPTVPEWAKQPDKPTYTASEVGALPSDTKIPSKVSELENDEKYAKTSELPQIDATLKQSGQAADAAETGKRIEAISPDDSTIDGKPWSSKQIIDTLCPPLEETGNPVQCYPVAGYPLGVKAKWEPVQEGSGTPSPENIRPIKGRDSVTITRQEDNQVITLTLPETVYGGEVDAVSGEGAETWKMVTLDGTEAWIVPSANKYYAFFGNPAASQSAYGYCSHYPYANDSSRKCAFANVNGAIVLYGHNADYTLAEFKAYLATQYAAGTPVQVCYELATPVPFTATGGAALPALDGANTVITDADSVDVTGRADPIKRITDLEDAVASMTTTEG